jgi:hypothetical protein
MQPLPVIPDYLYSSEAEESYYNIDEASLNESSNMMTTREQKIKTFKPGGAGVISNSGSN